MNVPQSITDTDDTDLWLNPERLVISLHRPLSHLAFVELISTFDLRVDDDPTKPDDKPGLADKGTTEDVTRYWVRSSDPLSEEMMQNLEAHDDIEWLAPVYQEPGDSSRTAYLAPRSDVVLVRYNDEHRLLRSVDSDIGDSG